MGKNELKMLRPFQVQNIGGLLDLKLLRPVSAQRNNPFLVTIIPKNSTVVASVHWKSCGIARNNNFEVISCPQNRIYKRNCQLWSTHTRGVTTLVQDGVTTSSKLQTFDDIPGPNTVPYFGSRFKYKPFGKWDWYRLHVANLEKYERYGPIVKEKNGIFSVDCLLLFDPKDVEKVFRNEGICPFRPSFQALVDHRQKHNYSLGLGQLQGEEWQTLRKNVQKKMMSLDAATPFILKQTETADDFIALIRVIQTESRDGTVKNLMQYLQRWSFESIVTAILGIRLGCLEHTKTLNKDISQLITDTCTIFETQYNLMVGVPWWKYWPTPTWIDFVNSHERIFKLCKVYTMKALEEIQNSTTPQKESSFSDSQPNQLNYTTRTDDSATSFISNNKHPNEPQSFISHLASERNLSLEDLLTTVIELMISGIQTTASALAFNLYHLAKNPESQSILRREIEAKLGPLSQIAKCTNESITSEKLRDMTYLRSIIWETSRLNPVAFCTIRILDQPIELSGYHVPARVPLIPQSMVISRIPAYFADHDKFKPERWFNHGSKKEFHPFCVLPYGHGPRMCIGRRFAEQELNLGLIKIFSNFEVSYENEEPIDCLTELIVKPDKPMSFKFKELS